MTESTKSKKAGRGKKYTTSQLKSYLYSYIEEYGGRIVISKLVKYSGIPRHIWDYNEDIQAEIERLGDPLARLPKIDNINDFDFKLVDIEQIIKTSKTQKDLIYALTSFKYQAEQAFEEALKYQAIKVEVDDLKAENEKLKNKLEQKENQLANIKTKLDTISNENIILKESVKGFENQLLNYGVDSTSILTRKKKNIEKNVIAYDFKRDEEENLSKAFPGLFGKK